MIDEMEKIAPENPLMFLHYLKVNAGKIPTIVEHLGSVRGDLKYQEAEELGLNLGTALQVRIYQSERLKLLIEGCAPRDAEEARFKKLSLIQFRKQPKELLEEYNKISVQFKDNIQADQKTYKLTLDYKDELVSGLEQNVIQHCKKEDKLVFDSTGFVMLNVLQHADSNELREKYWRYL